MGAAGSVVDPSALRREYEAKAAESVSDAELLLHMKKLIVSAPPGIHAVMSVGVTTMSRVVPTKMLQNGLEGPVAPLIPVLNTKIRVGGGKE